MAWEPGSTSRSKPIEALDYKQPIVPYTYKQTDGQVVSTVLEKMGFGNGQLYIYPKDSTANFRTQHSVTQTEKVLLDNLWIAYNSSINLARKNTPTSADRKLFLKVLNCLSGYFHKKNGDAKNVDFNFYLVLEGNVPGVYKTLVEVSDVIEGFKSPIFKGFNNFEEVNFEARKHLGETYFISPSISSYQSLPKSGESCKNCEAQKTDMQKIEHQLSMVQKEKFALEKKKLERELLINKLQSQIFELTKKSSAPHVEKIKNSFEIGKDNNKSPRFGSQTADKLESTSALIGVDFPKIQPMRPNSKNVRLVVRPSPSKIESSKRPCPDESFNSFHRRMEIQNGKLPLFSNLQVKPTQRPNASLDELIQQNQLEAEKLQEIMEAEFKAQYKDLIDFYPFETAVEQLPKLKKKMVRLVKKPSSSQNKQLGPTNPNDGPINQHTGPPCSKRRKGLVAAQDKQDLQA